MKTNTKWALGLGGLTLAAVSGWFGWTWWAGQKTPSDSPPQLGGQQALVATAQNLLKYFSAKGGVNPTGSDAAQNTLVLGFQSTWNSAVPSPKLQATGGWDGPTAAAFNSVTGYQPKALATVSGARG